MLSPSLYPVPLGNLTPFNIPQGTVVTEDLADGAVCHRSEYLFCLSETLETVL